MSIRKKILILVLFQSIPSSFVFAAGIGNPLTYATFGELINAIANFIFTVSLYVVPLFIVIAGFYFITANGDPAKIKTAKDIIQWTVIGFLIILLSTGIVKMLQTAINP